jgi:hypothetical protein
MFALKTEGKIPDTYQQVLEEKAKNSNRFEALLPLACRRSIALFEPEAGAMGIHWILSRQS